MIIVEKGDASIFPAPPPSRKVTKPIMMDMTAATIIFNWNLSPKRSIVTLR